MTGPAGEHAVGENKAAGTHRDDLNATINSYGPASTAPKSTSLLPGFGLVFFLAAIIIGFALIFIANLLTGCIVMGGGAIVGITILVWGEHLTFRKESAARASGAKTTNTSQVAIQQQLLRYQDLTRSQAAKAFWVGQSACVAGFVIIAGGCYVIVRQADAVSTQIVVAGLSALGAVLTSFIGSTFFRMYKQAQTQMNFYYAQPLVHSYLLHAKELSSGFTNPDARDAATGDIIKQTLEVAAVAAQLIRPDNTVSAGTFQSRKSQRAPRAATGASPALRQNPSHD